MKIGIIGATGRMGKTLIGEVAAHPKAELASALTRPGNAWIGKDAGVFAALPDIVGVKITDSAAEAVDAADVLIDFSKPEISLVCLKLASEAGKAAVICTTGFDEAQKAELVGYAKSAAIVLAPNTSLGVNILLHMVKQAAAVLDEAFDIEIVEMHHRNKVDAPSGTALALGQAAAEGRGVALKDVERLERSGVTGVRPRGEIGFATLRGGDVIGDHTVTFAGSGERIEFTHKSSSRQIYATGAIRAALWAAKQKPGLYTMQDVLGLN